MKHYTALIVLSYIVLFSCCCSKTAPVVQSHPPSVTPSSPLFNPRKALLGEWSCAETVFNKQHSLKSPTVYEFYEDGTIIHKYELPGSNIQKSVGNYTFMTDNKLRVKYGYCPEKDFFLDLKFESIDKMVVMENENEANIDTFQKIQK